MNKVPNPTEGVLPFSVKIGQCSTAREYLVEKRLR